MKKSLQNLPLVRKVSGQIIDRFAELQASAIDVHFDFPLLQRLALPITHGGTRMAVIKIHDIRMIRLMETVMHAGTCLNGWTPAHIHKRIVETYQLPHYTINQLRYDLRKMKVHGLIKRNGRQYSYCLTSKGMKVAAIFVLFHKRVCGPLANSLFNHRPDKKRSIDTELEKAYYKADDNIGNIIELLAV